MFISIQIEIMFYFTFEQKRHKTLFSTKQPKRRAHVSLTDAARFAIAKCRDDECHVLFEYDEKF